MPSFCDARAKNDGEPTPWSVCSVGAARLETRAGWVGLIFLASGEAVAHQGRFSTVCGGGEKHTQLVTAPQTISHCAREITRRKKTTSCWVVGHFIVASHRAGALADGRAAAIRALAERLVGGGPRRRHQQHEQRQQKSRATPSVPIARRAPDRRRAIPTRTFEPRPHCN